MRQIAPLLCCLFLCAPWLAQAEMLPGRSAIIPTSLSAAIFNQTVKRSAEAGSLCNENGQCLEDVVEDGAVFTDITSLGYELKTVQLKGSSIREIRVRGGVSGLSKEAHAGVDVKLSW